MKIVRPNLRNFIAFAVVLSFAVWSVSPNTAHVPTVLETIEEHLEMVEEHGHSHGFEEDLLWALHGHAHDVTDHDHSSLNLVFAKADLFNADADDWHVSLPDNKASLSYRIKRPPKV